MITADPLIFGKTSSDYAKYRDIYPLKSFTAACWPWASGRGGRTYWTWEPAPAFFPETWPLMAPTLPGQTFPRSKLSRQGFYPSKRALTSNTRRVPPRNFFSAENFGHRHRLPVSFYFNHQELAPRLYGILKPAGKLAVIYMAWLPYEVPSLRPAKAGFKV